MTLASVGFKGYSPETTSLPAAHIGYHILGGGTTDRVGMLDLYKQGVGRSAAKDLVRSRLHTIMSWATV